MEKFSFKVSSITNAQRGQKALAAKGIPSRVKRVQSPKPSEGCGYTIVASGSLKKAQKILEENSIRIVGIDNG